MTYQEIINGDTPVLVDFHATWCGPCKAMAPVLKDVADAMGDKARIIKIDVDKNQALAQKLSVRGVPTFIIYQKGKILWRQSGMQSGAELIQLLEDAASKVG